MDRGLYIAASGMVAEQVRQDLIANDLANASTPGYKADRMAVASFGRLPLANGGESPPLDGALRGEGFLSVQTPQGVRYTRNGQLQVDGQGRLVTQAGYPVLDRSG